ncbi:MAG: DMT family transporter [Desulfovibrio sp.]|nr:DMT family transporter [Desulfovibrio sp.]
MPRPAKRSLPHDWSEARIYVIFALAIFCLGGNFVLYNTSVIYLSAPAAQIISQTGPLILMLGGIGILREPFCRIQGIGGIVLVAGLILFFHDRLHELTRLDGGYGLGIAIGSAGALVWGMYGVAQKLLLREFSPAGTLRIIYTCVSLALIPFAEPSTLTKLDSAQWVCLAYCCLNTIVAYGCFSKAIGTWHTAGVGAILSLTPLFTLAGSRLTHVIAPNFFPDAPLDLINYTGALTVVAGAAALAVGPHLSRRRHFQSH